MLQEEIKEYKDFCKINNLKENDFKNLKLYFELKNKKN